MHQAQLSTLVPLDLHRSGEWNDDLRPHQRMQQLSIDQLVEGRRQ